MSEQVALKVEGSADGDAKALAKGLRDFLAGFRDFGDAEISIRIKRVVGDDAKEPTPLERHPLPWVAKRCFGNSGCIQDAAGKAVIGAAMTMEVAEWVVGSVNLRDAMKSHIDRLQEQVGVGDYRDSTGHWLTNNATYMNLCDLAERL